MNDRYIVTGHFRGDDSQKWAVIPQNDGTFMVQNIAYSDVLDSNHPGDVYRHIYTVVGINNGFSFQQVQLHQMDPSLF